MESMTYCGVPGQSGDLVGGSSGRNGPSRRRPVWAVCLGRPAEGHALRLSGETEPTTIVVLSNRRNDRLSFLQVDCGALQLAGNWPA
jgi:hypothetical protein